MPVTLGPVGWKKSGLGRLKFPGGQKARDLVVRLYAAEKEGRVWQTCLTGSSLEFFELCVVKVASETLGLCDTARVIREA